MMVCPLPHGELLDGFRASLDTVMVADLIRDHMLVEGTVELERCRPDYVRYKEQDGCLVGYRVVLRDRGVRLESYVTARSAPAWRLRAEAERLAHRQTESWRHLRSLVLLEERGLLLLALPVDRAIPDLRRMVRASKIRNLLLQNAPHLVPEGLRPSKRRSSFDLVRYKPERRAVLRWSIGLVDQEATSVDQRNVYVRLYADPIGGRVRRAQRAAKAAGLLCPEILALPHAGLLVETEIQGKRWFPGSEETTGAADLLATLHGADHPDPCLQHTPLQEMDRTLRACEDLGRLDAELGRRGGALADRLARSVPAIGKRSLLHGDFHRGQLLQTGSGPGLVDFDRSVVGAAAVDLASFWAHEVLRDMDTADRVHDGLEHAYAELRKLPGREELCWYRACALLRVSMTPFRTLQSDWPDRIHALLDRAESECGGLAP